MADTAYIVLRRANQRSGKTDHDDSTLDGWTWHIENSNVPASSAEGAIRLACKTDQTPAGTYVAVPARSWRPVTVKAEQTVTLKLEQAT